MSRPAGGNISHGHFQAELPGEDVGLRDLIPQIWYSNSVPWSYFLKNTQLTHITISVFVLGKSSV